MPQLSSSFAPTPSNEGAPTSVMQHVYAVSGGGFSGKTGHVGIGILCNHRIVFSAHVIGCAEWVQVRCLSNTLQCLLPFAPSKDRDLETALVPLYGAPPRGVKAEAIASVEIEGERVWAFSFDSMFRPILVPATVVRGKGTKWVLSAKDGVNVVEGPVISGRGTLVGVAHERQGDEDGLRDFSGLLSIPAHLWM